MCSCVHRFEVFLPPFFFSRMRLKGANLFRLRDAGWENWHLKGFPNRPAPNWDSVVVS